MSTDLSPAALALFLEYARDAGNWSGAPLVDGNVEGSPERNGYLLRLKLAGFITTQYEKEPGRPGCTWMFFTAEGKALAAAHGVNLT
jgi:hypothetical protein